MVSESGIGIGNDDGKSFAIRNALNFVGNLCTGIINLTNPKQIPFIFTPFGQDCSKRCLESSMLWWEHMS